MSMYPNQQLSAQTPIPHPNGTPLNTQVQGNLNQTQQMGGLSNTVNGVATQSFNPQPLQQFQPSHLSNALLSQETYIEIKVIKMLEKLELLSHFNIDEFRTNLLRNTTLLAFLARRMGGNSYAQLVGSRLSFRIEGLESPQGLICGQHDDDTAALNCLLIYLLTCKPLESILAFSSHFGNKNYNLIISFDDQSLQLANRLRYILPSKVTLEQLVWFVSLEFGITSVESVFLNLQKFTHETQMENSRALLFGCTFISSVVSNIIKDVFNNKDVYNNEILKYKCLLFQVIDLKCRISLGIGNNFTQQTNYGEAASLIWFLQHLNENPADLTGFRANFPIDEINVLIKTKYGEDVLNFFEAIEFFKEFGRKPTNAQSAALPINTPALAQPQMAVLLQLNPNPIIASSSTSLVPSPKSSTEDIFIKMLQKLDLFPSVNFADFRNPLNPYLYLLEAVKNDLFLHFKSAFGMESSSGLPFRITTLESPNGWILEQREDTAALHLLLRYLNNVEYFDKRLEFSTLFKNKNYKMAVLYQNIIWRSALTWGYILPYRVTLEQLMWISFSPTRISFLGNVFLEMKRQWGSTENELSRFKDFFKRLEDYFIPLKYNCLLLHVLDLNWQVKISLDQRTIMRHMRNYDESASFVWFMQHLNENPNDLKDFKDSFPVHYLKFQFEANSASYTFDEAIFLCKSVGRTSPSSSQPIQPAIISNTQVQPLLPLTTNSTAPASSDSAQNRMQIDPPQQNEIKPLMQLLQDQPALKSEAETLFRILSERIFLKNDMLCRCLRPYQGIWHFDFDRDSFATLNSILIATVLSQLIPS